MTLRFLAVQLFLTTAIAFARDDAPPSPVRPWAPPTLPRYEGELRHYKLTEGERRYYPAIDPRKTYNLAELIDIAQRSNPETRVAWERARQAAAAVDLTESAYYRTSSRLQSEDMTGPLFHFQRCALSNKSRQLMATCQTSRLLEAAR
jgi:hypothetical protein